MSPKTNPPSGNLRNGRQKNQLAEGNPEAVHAESGSREPEGQLAEGNPEAGGGRTNPPSGNPEAVSPKANPPSGNPEAEGGSTNPPSGKRRNGRQKHQLAEGNPEAVHAEKRKP